MVTTAETYVVGVLTIAGALTALALAISVFEVVMELCEHTVAPDIVRLGRAVIIGLLLVILPFAIGWIAISVWEKIPLLL